MPHRSLTVLIGLAIAASIAEMTLAARADDRMLHALASALLAGAIVGAALVVNMPAWRVGGGDGAARSAIYTNTVLAALTYAWGAAAFFAVYGLSDVAWRHWWQYGTGAALFAIGISRLASRIGAAAAGTPPLSLTLAHGGAAALGLVFLIGSGKLATTKGDWVANDIFLFGGLAIILLCAIAACTQIRLAKPSR